MRDGRKERASNICARPTGVPAVASLGDHDITRSPGQVLFVSHVSPSKNVSPQVEQEAEEVNRVRRKLVMRVEDVLEQEFKARPVLCSWGIRPRAPRDCGVHFLMGFWGFLYTKANE